MQTPRSRSLATSVLPTALALALFGLSAAAQAGAIAGYDEAVDGDLSGNGLAPTVFNLSPGAFVLRGTTGRSATTGLVDRDYFSVTVPAGHVLDSLTVMAGTAVLGDGSFIGLMAGPTFSVPPTTGDATGLLGWTLYNADDIGSDLLITMSNPFFGSSGFARPLPAGSYSFWVQETALGTSVYNFTLNVAAVPEPATALSLLAGLGLLAAARQRRVRH